MDKRDWTQCDESLSELKRIAGTRPEVILLDLKLQYSKNPIGQHEQILASIKKLEMTFADSMTFWRGRGGLVLADRRFHQCAAGDGGAREVEYRAEAYWAGLRIARKRS